PFDPAELDYWLGAEGVERYIGGIEHAVLHLLYARFFTKVLRDLGFLRLDEPFRDLLTQGMVIKDGAKISKSKGNVVDPDYVVERLHFNTAVAAVMELVNALGDASGQTSPAVLREAIDATLLLLAPFVPHIASELWEAAGHARALDAERWPAADPGALARELIELPVQVNGKLRGRVTLPADAGEAPAVAAALADPHSQAHLAGRP